MSPRASDPRSTKRDRIFVGVVGVVLGALAPLATWTTATVILACLALVCLGVAAFGEDRAISRVAQLFSGWP